MCGGEVGRIIMRFLIFTIGIFLATALVISADAGNIFQEQAVEQQQKDQIKKEQWDQKIKEKFEKMQKIWETKRKATEKRRTGTKSGDRAAAGLIGSTIGIGKEAIGLTRCFGGNAPRSNFDWRVGLELCQRYKQNYGLTGIDCETCSGNFSYYNYEFHSRGGNIIFFKFINEGGIQITYHGDILTVVNPSTGHFISYTTAYLFDLISFGDDVIEETNPIKIHVTNVHLPVEVQSSLVSFYKGQKFDFKETYAVIDSVYQKASAIGIDPVQFAFDLITQPGQLLQRLKAEEIAGKENGK